MEIAPASMFPEYEPNSGNVVLRHENLDERWRGGVDGQGYGLLHTHRQALNVDNYDKTYRSLETPSVEVYKHSIERKQTQRDKVIFAVRERQMKAHAQMMRSSGSTRQLCDQGDMQVGDMNAQAPVGTTLALMERSMKVMSGVQARLHAAMKEELRILARIVHDYMPSEYAYEMDEPADRAADFDGRVDVVPVSDPNAATMAQRIMQYQAALQMSQQAPQLYDLGKLHRQMLEVLGIPDAEDIIKLPDDIKPADPVSENMSIMKQEPVKAFSYQDHEAHIMTHMAALQDPKIQQIVGQSPFAGAIQAAMQSHVTEHIALQYRKEIEAQLGTELPNQDEPLPESVELELSKVVAQAAGQLLKKDQAEVAAEENAKQQADPLTQLQQREMAIKEQELQHKMQMDQAKLQLDMENKRANIGVQEDRLEAENIKSAANIQLKVAELQADEDTTAIKLAMEAAKEINDRD